MGVVAIALRELIAAGLTGDALVAAVERIEEASQASRGDVTVTPVTAEISNGAVRTRRWREQKANKIVTRDVTVTSQASQSVTGDGCDVTSVTVTSPPVPLSPPSSSPPHPPSNNPLNPPTPVSLSSKAHCGRAATRSAVDQAFEDFWRAYPKRDGANPRAPAAKKFAAALKAGCQSEEIVAGARAYRAACDEGKLTGTPMVAQAITWLNQQRWGDYAAQKPPALAEPKGRDPPELPPEKRHFYRWFSSKTPEGLPPEQWQAFAEGRINGAEIS